jgi:peptidoglycan hydrolase-like protein with peptidoglycan-binding domain
MRVAGAVVALLVGVLSASAQEVVRTPRPKPASAAPAAKPPVAAAATPATAAQTGSLPPKAAKPPARKPGDTYAGIPLPERIAIQSDLIWTGDYNGIANGEFDARTVAALKAYQKKFKSKETGILNPQERAALAASAKERRDAVGWRMIDDPLGGGRIGLPAKLLTQSAKSSSGSRWTSAHGESVVETFRVKDPGTTLAAVFAQQRKEPVDRKTEYNVMKDDFFVLSGLQGLKKFYVRAQIKDNEVRGLTVLYDQALEGTMDKIVVAMSSAFVPFSGEPPLAPPPPKRNVDYSTGIVVSAGGDIVADRQMTDGCNVILVPRLGNAERLAEDQASNLALLRVYGARDLMPLALAGEASAGPELTIVGIADPQAQSGGGAVSTASARLTAAATRAVEPAPALGFSGAAAIDGQGRVAGMVQLKPQVVAGTGPTTLPAAATIVPADSVRKFLQAQGVSLVAGRSGVDDAKASVVRVVCVRK